MVAYAIRCSSMVFSGSNLAKQRTTVTAVGAISQRLILRRPSLYLRRRFFGKRFCEHQDVAGAPARRRLYAIAGMYGSGLRYGGRDGGPNTPAYRFD